jgi:hypothetical protein
MKYKNHRNLNTRLTPCLIEEGERGKGKGERERGKKI